MKRKLFFIVLLSLLLAMLIPASGLAQGGLTYTSGVQVVNLDTSTATIKLIYYNQDGTEAANVDDTIAGSSSKTYFPIGAPAGFNGSLVISADRPIAAIANTITPDFTYGAATTSFSAGNTTFSLPLVMCNNSGFDTWFNVQNAGGSNANITIDYLPGSDGTADSETDTITPGASHTFDQSTGSSTVNCGTLADAGTGKFIGGAVITSDQPVVATVMQVSTSGFDVLMGYNGFASGSSEISLPLIMANNNSFYTGVQVQNTGTAQTTVTLEYASNTAGSFTPTDDTCVLDPGESCTKIQNSGQWTGQYIGAATVTQTGSEPLVAIVNQVSTGPAAGLGPYGTAYEGFDPSVATSNASAPLVMANNSGYYTGIQTQNVGGGDACAITIDYGPNTASGGTFNPVNESFTLDVGESKTIIQNGAPAGNGGSNNWTGVGAYIGSAQISASGCDIVAIVNEVSLISGDNFFSYDAFNTP